MIPITVSLISQESVMSDSIEPCVKYFSNLCGILTRFHGSLFFAVHEVVERVNSCLVLVLAVAGQLALFQRWLCFKSFPRNRFIVVLQSRKAVSELKLAAISKQLV